MRIKIGQLKKMIREAVGGLDPDTHPGVPGSSLAGMLARERERPYNAEDDEFSAIDAEIAAENDAAMAREDALDNGEGFDRNDPLPPNNGRYGNSRRDPERAERDYDY